MNTMPWQITFFRDAKGRTPSVEFFRSLPQGMRDRIRERLTLLSELGDKLHRPIQDPLRDGIREIRVNRYRLLFCFHGTQAILMSHGLYKNTDRVPDKDIDQALKNRALWIANPTKHTSDEEI